MKTKIIRTEVLVIGSGAAGLRCAIELQKNKVDTLIVGKCQKRDAHTVLAAGGINAALGNMDKEDSWQQHAADTIRDGGGINDPTAVQLLAKHAPDAIKELAKWGTKFHKEKNGKISQRFFGAATYRRACFSGDVTGKAILNTLIDRVQKLKTPFKSEVYIIELLTHGKAVNGAIGLDMKKGQLIIFEAKSVVLATGGHSRVYQHSSSRFWENTGDGIALAYNVGASFMDMEMFQFHPTGMVWPKKMEGMLVTEAVRGEGGILTNVKGKRFMENIDPERKELSARDVVARAIYKEIKAGKGTKRGGVYLDISHRSHSYLKRRLPKMVKQFMDSQKLDISKQKMQVAPTAHYSMGGIHVDHKTGKTGIKNLYAIGEVTSGVHGGNRLGGNSLAECMVFGKLTGLSIVQNVKRVKFFPINDENIEKNVKKFAFGSEASFIWDEKTGGKKSSPAQARREKIVDQQKGENPTTLKQELQAMMWKHAGVMKNEKELKAGLKKLEKLRNTPLKTGSSLKMNEKLIAALDLKAMFITCEMILKSALMRKESRAAHARTDYPKLSKAWNKNIVCNPTTKGFKLTSKKLDPLPNSIKQLLKKRVEAKLLE